MKEIIIGMLSGTVAALGMGGGTVLILLFSIFTEYDQHLIQGTNLIFFIPTSIVAIYMNVKNKIIDFKISKIIVFSGVIGAIVGSYLSFKFESELLRKIFGIFLLFIACLEIYSLIKQYKQDKKENNK